MTRPGPATGGSAVFQAFVDDDGDGVFDPEERPVADAALEGGERKVATGPTGRAFATGLGAAATSRLQVGLDKLDDPFLMPPPQMIEFAPRPGLLMNIQYPLVPTGEVMARVVVRRPDGRTVGVSALRIRLVADGQAPLEGATEFDGSVLFQQLRPGRYALELDPDQASRLGMRLRHAVEFVVEPGGGPVADLVAEVSVQQLGPALIMAGAQGGDPIADLLAERLGAVAASPDPIGDLLAPTPSGAAPRPVAANDAVGELILASAAGSRP